MDHTLQDVLDDRGGNYILPFFWQHGEEGDVLREEMRRIHEAGIGAVCIEARPHPDFGGPLWWRDMDLILDEARKRGMKVWLLDDAHFPTGIANGWIRDRFPEKGKKYLAEKSLEVSGPLSGCSFRVDAFLNRFDWQHPQEKLFGDDRLLHVVATRLSTGLSVDLTAAVKDGKLQWDVPEGHWRISCLFLTRSRGGNPDYINMLDAASVRVLLDAVHEPHYARYSADFGKTFAGFFSDEPGFGNTKGFNFDEIVGRKDMVLPWSDEMGEVLSARLGDGYPVLLPALWNDAGPATPHVRFAYMDCATRLYEKSFARQIGDWCSDHGVAYIGHVIEDQNVHARLGCGPGHYFRALSGQHMAGIDIIGNQVLPRLEDFRDVSVGNTPDFEFFHFALAKLGSSLGHIDPAKKGRTVVEAFGAAGWSLGLRNMKWIVDHALVRGINHFTPHAFSAKDFPDPDCPPHFYARGHNPQFRYFGELMRYTNRMCHLLNGGLHVAPVAVLYHAEAEWSGRAMYCQKPAHQLTRNQIDFDFLPSDLFARPSDFDARIDGGILQVHGESFRCLVLPYGQYVTSAVAAFAGEAARTGFPVWFVDALPEGLCDAVDANMEKRLLEGLQGCTVVSLAALAGAVRARGLAEVEPLLPSPYLRYYHYRHEEGDLFLFFNEHPFDRLKVDVRVPQTGAVERYDAFLNRTFPQACRADAGGTTLSLDLDAYESTVVVFTPGPAASFLSATRSPVGVPTVRIEVRGPWTVSQATALEIPDFSNRVELPALVDLGTPERSPDFSGTFRYEATLHVASATGRATLDLGRVFETAEVHVNGRPAGVRICPPYRFDVSRLLKPGPNTLQVDVTTTLAREQKDAFSIGNPLEPSGLLGPVGIVIA